MNYISILRSDVCNGNGFRVTLFVSGCARHCKGCFNPGSHDPSHGKPFDAYAKEKIFKELDHEYCAGLSILGGEPLSKLTDNRKQVIAFAKEVKERYPSKNIWLWSSYYLDEIKNDDSMKDILKYVDVLVDGPFEEDKKDLSISFRGSSNQRILHKGVDF